MYRLIRKSLFLPGIRFFDVLEYFSQFLLRVRIRVIHIPEQSFMRNIIVAANVLETFDSSVCRRFRSDRLVNVNQKITAAFNQQTGSLNPSHIVVCVNAADILILPFNCYDWNIIGCKFFGRKGVTQDNKTFNLIRQKFLNISPFCFFVVISQKNKEFVSIGFIGG